MGKDTVPSWIKIGNSSENFKCKKCGCNLFHADETEKGLWTCNSCGQTYGDENYNEDKSTPGYVFRTVTSDIQSLAFILAELVNMEKLPFNDYGTAIKWLVQSQEEVERKNKQLKAKISKCKFTGMNFQIDGYDYMYVAHANKFTKEQSIEQCMDENHWRFENEELRIPCIDDVNKAHVKYFINPPADCSSDLKGGVYSFCAKGDVGSFPVWIIAFAKLR